MNTQLTDLELMLKEIKENYPEELRQCEVYNRLEETAKEMLNENYNPRIERLRNYVVRRRNLLISYIIDDYNKKKDLVWLL